ncbi:unnamed protein product, partial [Candidula unifasciata]
VRGDGRKRKFKPLSAMKKFFTKKKDKKDSVVAVKAKSTTALPAETDDDEDDDDGGFRAHSKRSVLAGNRSLSEDSVFSTEARGQPIAAFPKAALSEESLPKSAFQSELMSKLNKRRSEYLDDDNDDGLPRSPVPAVTTADVILGEPLKKQLSQFGKTSNNRDSDQSLISVDSSENEEEELFMSKWKSSVPARKSASLPATSSKTMDTLDFNSIQKTELLVSKAAKHKMKVKPARKANRQSLKHRDTSSPTPLPCLNEESPTSSKYEEVKEGRTSAAPPPAVSAAAPPSAVSATPAPTVSATAAASVSAVTSQSPTAAVSAVISQPPTATVSAQSPTVASAPSPTTVVFAIPSPTAVETATTPVSPTVRFPPQTGSISDLPPHNMSQSGSATLPSATVAQLIAAPKVFEKKIEENLSLSDRGDKTILSDTHISFQRLSQSQKGVTDNKFDTDIKSRMSHFQMPGPSSGKLDAFNSTPADILPNKETNLESTSVTVLKEDYKVKHQVRSRTLPAVIGEQTSPKVQRSSSHRIPNKGIDFPEPRNDSTVLSDENVILSSTSVSLSSSLPDSKKSESVKVSTAESKVGISAGEPSWMNMVRRKKSGQETNIEIEKVKTDDAAATTRPGLSTSAPKSIFTSSSYLEKKRGSTEAVSFKGRELSEASAKKADSSDTKRQSLDLTSQNKQAATEPSSSSKESVEVEVTHLGSVKASRGIFDSSSKFVSQRDSVIPTPSAASTAAERIRKFSSSSSAIPGSNSVKGSNTNQEVPAAAAVANDAKPVAPVGGITHARGGSVKASLPKATEVKSSIYTRNGSVKGPSTLSAASSSTSESPASASVKAEAVSAFKPDSFETTPPSASPQPSAQHVPAHVAAPPNPSLPSQTSSVTPLTYLVQPFNAYSSNPSNNYALASRSAYAATKPYSKFTSAPTNTATILPYPASEPALIAVKTASIPNVKLLTSSSNAATSSFALPNVSSSSSSSRKNSMKSTLSLFTQASSLSSSTLSVSHSSTIQAQSSITSSTASKSHSSHVSQFNSTSTSSIRKSSSFKAATTSSEKVVPFQKVVVPEKSAADVRKQATPAKVPAWRTNLLSKEVKIEIIENSPSPAPASSTQTSSENLRKPHDKAKQQETLKKTEGTAAAGLTVETEKTTRRTSKVLDMVKNFQNLQAPS